MPSEATPLGPTPDGWGAVPLDAVSEFITKGATPTTYGFSWVDQGIPFLRSECVGERGFTESGMQFIPAEAHTQMARSVVQGGDILVTITGNVGRVVLYPAYLGEGNINQHIARVRIRDKSNRIFGLRGRAQNEEGHDKDRNEPHLGREARDFHFSFS